jgi:two-component system, NtrC family, sensor kinase
MTRKKNELQDEFELMLANVIVPGIIHNFANPLNGIVGRARLLKRKIDEQLKSIEDLRDQDFCRMTSKDVWLICQEADRLSSLLLVISEKFYALNNLFPQKINLSRLLEMEIKFLDFNLDFKHNVQKTIALEPDIPDMKGVAAEISSCLGAIFQNIVSRTLATERKELRLTSSFSDGRIDVEFKWTGPVRKSALKDFRGYPTIRAVLEKYGINYTQSRDGEFQVLNLSAPVSQE